MDESARRTGEAPPADEHPRLTVGDEIPPLQRTTGLLEWNRYAAVNDELVSIHMDDDAARRSGLPGAVGMGNLQIAYLHVMLRNWIGPQGRIARLTCQHRGYNLRGDVLTCRGRITAIRDRTVDLAIWVENGDGVVISPGTATVEFPETAKGTDS